MTADARLMYERFPRSSKYHPDWVIASGGANALWLTEWLAEALDLRPDMNVLDLGCGLAMSSIFLRREFGVRVWATDLWFSASGQPAARAGCRCRRIPSPRTRFSSGAAAPSATSS
jgi:cyclopropane fatty-acyl-phospholipid synthase-like methyltransferase